MGDLMYIFCVCAMRSFIFLESSTINSPKKTRKNTKMNNNNKKLLGSIKKLFRLPKMERI